jgi:signal transduction histidine kinase
VRGRGGRRRWSVRAKLTLALLAASLAPTAVVATLAFINQRDAVTADALDRLNAVAAVQESRVNAWIQTNEDDLRLVASQTQLAISLSTYLANGSTEALGQIDESLIDARNSISSLLNVYVLDLDGRIVAATDPDRVGENIADMSVVGSVPDLPTVQTVARARSGGAVGLQAGPIGGSGLGVGVLVLETSLEPLRQLVADPTGIGETGETLLLARNNAGRPVVLVPSRFAPDANMAELPFVSRRSASLDALDGVEGVRDDAIDYRRQRVFAASRYLPTTDWGLVVKVDRSEALDPVDRFALVIVLSALGVGLLGALTAWLVPPLLTRPIAELTDTAGAVARGERDRRAPIRTRDELADLAEAFNAMTDELVASTKEVEARRTQLEHFLYVSSHDLKTPLRAITSFSQLMAMDCGDQLDEQGRHYLDTITEGATRMLAIVDDLLAYVRLDRVESAFEETSLNDVVGDATASLQVELAEAHAELVVGPLPTVNGSRTLLVEVFQNLIGNAVRYRGPRRPRIEISAADAGELVAIRVADNGIGIPPEQRDRVFKPFERLHRADDIPGTGLGLAVVKNIVILHHGRIAVESNEWGGTTMAFTLAREAEEPEKGVIVVPGAVNA